jgi:type II secretion system protein H
MRRSDPTLRPEAFTLVELVLVMALLCVILAIAAPSLSRSMHGRNLIQEATRLLALTDFARDEATSKGVPMVVWVNQETGQFGVRAKSGYEDAGARSKQFTLADGIRFDALTVATGTASFTGNADSKQYPGESEAVEYAPDGTIDPASDTAVRLVDQSNSTVGIEQATDAWGYEIVTNPQ